MVKNFQYIHNNYSSAPFNTGDSIKMCWLRVRPPQPERQHFPAFPTTAPSLAFSRPLASCGRRRRVHHHRRQQQEMEKRAHPWLLWRHPWHRQQGPGQDGASTGVGTEVENGTHQRKFPMPVFAIFDEKARLSGSLFWGLCLACRRHVPSPDNSKEIEAGWFIVADNRRTGRKWDGETRIHFRPGVGQRDRGPLEPDVRGRRGHRLGRTTGLNPIAERRLCHRVVPGLSNTQGGMKRNTKSQVLDILGTYPRLYAAGGTVTSGP